MCWSARSVGYSWLIQPLTPSYEQYVSCSFCLWSELRASLMLIFLLKLSAGNLQWKQPCLPFFVFLSFYHGPLLNPPLMATVSLIRKILLSFTDHNTMSGQRVVWTSCRNYSHLPKLTLISQEQAVYIRLGYVVLVEKGLAPSLMKVTVFLTSVSAGVFSKLSCSSV